MSEYTAEDFAAAQFAVGPGAGDLPERYWARYDDDDYPWRNGRGVWRSDDAMAEGRCVPVYAEPYSPKALKRAREHGEKPEPGEIGTQGMVTMQEVGNAGNYTVFVNTEGAELLPIERIIYRPPVPELDAGEVERQRNRDAIRDRLGELVGTIVIHDEILDEWADELAQHLSADEQGDDDE